MRRQQQELMRWHLADTASDKRHSCSQSVRTLLHLVLSSLFSSLQMWLRKPLPWQSTQRNLLLWVILRWTATYWRDSSYALALTNTHLYYSWRFSLSASLSFCLPSLSLSLSLPPLLPLPLFRPGQMEHFSTLAPGALVRWQNDLSWKCQVHQREWVIELIKETEE